MILIDTSAWLFALKKNFHPVVKNRVEEFLENDEVAIIGIIQLELLGGTKTREEYLRLKTRLDSLYYIDSSRSLWDAAASLAFDLRRKGYTIPHTDILIASAALNEDATLVHADSHFDLIAKHSILKVESLTHLINLQNL